jgi:hypothetical protein
MRDQLVTETIDARILRLIGLEEAFDLDYDTYLILLKEAQVKGKNTLPAEEQAILANERKRVRGKVGRFKTKSINVNNITSVGRIGQKLLPTARGVGYAPIVKSLASIGAIVESISDNLSDQSKDDKKEAEENRKDEENKRRRKREESLEASAKKVVSAAKKLFAPVRGILDSIYNYLFYTFLGRGINESLNWLANPENKNKVAALGQFVKDFWPALLGTAVAFFTPLGNFIRTVLGEITKLAFRFPLVAAAAGVTALGELGAAKMREVTGKEYRLTGYEGTVPGVAPGRVPEVNSKKKSAAEIKENQEAPYGRNPDGSPRLFPKLFESGGFVDQNTGLKISGAGPDTQLTALQPGEVVMNRAAVRAVGAGNLLNLNRMYGGPNANRPKFTGNIQLARGGGIVGGFLNWWNKGRNVRVQNESRASWFDLMRDDFKQRGQSDANFARGSKPSLFGRPDRGVFSRDFLDWHRTKTQRNPLGIPRPRYVPAEKGGTGSAPTPAVRQAFERLPQYLTAMSFGMNIHNMMEQRNTTTRARQYGYGTVEDMMVAPERYQTPVQLGRKTPKTSTLSPSPRSKTNLITLPPVAQNASMSTPTAGGSEVPSFSAIAPGNRRLENAQIYGIIP